VNDDETWREGGVSPTLNAFDQGDTRATVVVVGTLQSQPRGVPSTDEIAGGQAVINGSNVRRLTPIECERLQGFPDDWTAGLADTHRYKQMGNAVTVNVAHYIGWLLDD
jgi:site-specific DNA-cytosine methylase